MCAGYGGIGLGIKNIFGDRMRTLAYCELEGFAQANLISKMEKGLMDVAPLWNDLKTFPYRSFYGLVDILIAGYPCQPFSAAGKRAGKEDPRHLWPWIADGIRLLQPRMCFFENVEGHISLGLREVIGELEQIGYQTAFGIFSAREVGAVHQRKRVFIMAYLKCEGLEGLYHWNSPSEQTESFGADSGAGCQRSAWEGCELANSTSDRLARGLLNGETLNQTQGNTIKRGSSWPSRPGEPQHGWEPPRVVANSVIVGRRGGDHADQGGLRGEIQTEGSCGSRGEEVLGNTSEQGCEGSGKTNDPRWTIDRPTESNGGCAYGAMEQNQRQTEPPLGGDFDGTSDRLDYAQLQVSCDNRTDELRLLGNGVVPATAERAFRTLLTELITK